MVYQIKLWSPRSQAILAANLARSSQLCGNSLTDHTEDCEGTKITSQGHYQVEDHLN